MGCACSSKQKADLETQIRSCAREFQEAHCLLDENATTDAMFFMVAFIAFARHKQKCELNECTAQWMSELIQEQCPALYFIGNNPRTFNHPYIYNYIFRPIVVIGTTLINLQSLKI